MVTRAALPAACHMVLATAIAATAMKHARCGNVHPHTVLPFVVEHMHAGGINKGGMQFFRMCRDAADSKPNARAVLLVQQEALYLFPEVTVIS